MVAKSDSRHCMLFTVQSPNKKGNAFRVILVPEMYPEFYDNFQNYLMRNEYTYVQSTIDVNQRIDIQEDRSYEEYLRVVELMKAVEKTSKPASLFV